MTISKFSTRFLFVCLGLLFSISSQAGSLKSVLDHTIKTNPDVLAAEKERVAADYAVKGARGEFFPNLDLAAGIGVEDVDNETTRQTDEDSLTRRELSLIASQELFTGLSTVYEVKRNEARVNSFANLVDTSAEDTALDVTRVYLNVLRQQDLVQIARANVAAHQKTYDMIQKRADSGVSRKADSVQAEGRLALSHANFKAEEGNLKEAKVIYERVVGMPPGKLSMPSISSKFFPKTRKEATQMALDMHPTLKSANADIDAARAQHKASFAPNYPHFSLQAGITRDEDIDGIDGHNYSDFAMLRLNYNLFNGGSDMARQRETAYFTDQATEIRNRTYRQVSENMGLAWTALETNRRLLKYVDTHRAASKKTVGAYRQQFKIGQRTLLDLLDSENEYFSARNAYTRTKYDMLLSKYRILNAEGKLLDAVGVAHPVTSAVYEEMQKAKEAAAKAEKNKAKKNKQGVTTKTNKKTSKKTANNKKKS